MWSHNLVFSVYKFMFWAPLNSFRIVSPHCEGSSSQAAVMCFVGAIFAWCGCAILPHTPVGWGIAHGPWRGWSPEPGKSSPREEGLSGDEGITVTLARGGESRGGTADAATGHEPVNATGPWVSFSQLYWMSRHLFLARKTIFWTGG